MDIIDLLTYEKTRSFLTGVPTAASIKAFNSFLRSDPNQLVVLYHGTSKKLPIMDKGLLPTTANRRNSYQSGSGYVYLTPYPSVARMFGEMAFQKNAVVYGVYKTIRNIKPDKDQLINKRIYAGIDMGNSLAASILVGHSVMVKGKIDPMQIWLTDF